MRDASFEGFIGTRSEDPAVWNAKTLQVGDKVTGETITGEEVTGRFIERKDDYKSYQLGEIKIFSEEDGAKRIEAKTLKNISKDTSWRKENELPENYSLPDKFEEYTKQVYEDAEEDKEYLAWDYRKGKFITVVPDRFNTYTKVGGHPEKPYRQSSVSNENPTYKIKIVGKEIDQQTPNEYDLPVPQNSTDESLDNNQTISSDWFEYINEATPDEIKEEISTGDNISPEQAEILQAYLLLGNDTEEVPMYASSNTFRAKVSDFVEYKEFGVSSSQASDVFASYDKVVKDINPVIGSHVLANIEKVIAKDFTGSYKAGDHNSNKNRIRLGVHRSRKEIKSTMAHEVGHEVHHLLGLGFDNSTYNDDNLDKDILDIELGIDSSVVDDEAEEALSYLRKAWEEHKENPNYTELREYERKHGVEKLAVSYRYYVEKPDRLKFKSPRMYLFWEEYSENKERVENFDELEPGASIGVDLGQPEMKTVDTIQKIEENSSGKIEVTMEDGVTYRRNAFEQMEWVSVK